MHCLWHNIRNVCKLIRVATTFNALIIIVVISFYKFHNLTSSVILGTMVMFTASYGFALNDYFDYKKDANIPAEHLIASGTMSRRRALIISLCFLCLSLILTCFIYSFQQVLNILLLFILSIYSYVNNRFGIIANALVAFCSAIGMFMTMNKFEWSIISFSSLTFFLYIFAREIILDIHDCEADRNIGKSSFPILITVSKSFLIAAFISVCCITYSVFVGIYFGKWEYILLTFVANVIFLMAIFSYRSKMDERTYRRFVLFSRLSFLLSLPATLL